MSGCWADGSLRERSSSTAGPRSEGGGGAAEYRGDDGIPTTTSR